MKRDEKYLTYFALRNFDATWQSNLCYTDVKVERISGYLYIVATTTRGHAFKPGTKMFYDFDCDFFFDLNKWIHRPSGERKQALRSAMGF